MNKVKVIVDSTCDLSPELYHDFDMEVIPLAVRFGEETYEDKVTIDTEKLYSKVKEYKSLPQTSSVSPDVIEATFKKWIDQGYDIVFTGIGSTLSSTMQNAFIAKGSFPEDRVYLIDSKNLSSASGLLALKAARMAKEGVSAKEIAEKVQPLAEKLSCQFVVETLDYLHKGGRCSGTAKIIGTLFHVHPMIKVMDGKLNVFAKPRGTHKMCCGELLKIFKADLAKGIDMENVMITSSGCCPDIAEYLKEELSKLIDPKVIRVTEAGCAISSHCGPATIGILYIQK